MNKQHKILLSLVAAAVLAPSASFASSLYHETGGEMGSSTNPSHVTSQVSRSDVLQALDAARKDGTLAILSKGGVPPVSATGPAKTRDEVRQEYLNMSVEERVRLQRLHGR